MSTLPTRREEKIRRRIRQCLKGNKRRFESDIWALAYHRGYWSEGDFAQALNAMFREREITYGRDGKIVLVTWKVGAQKKSTITVTYETDEGLVREVIP